MALISAISPRNSFVASVLSWPGRRRAVSVATIGLSYHYVSYLTDERINLKFLSAAKYTKSDYILRV